VRNPSPVFLRSWVWSCYCPHALDSNPMFPPPLPLPRDGVLCVWRSGSRGREGRSFVGARDLGSARWVPSPGSGSRPFQGCSPARG